MILGTLPPLTSDAEIKRFGDALTAAQNCFSGAALRGLPSIQLVAKFGELQEADIDAAESVLESVEAEAKSLVERLSDADRSDRLRLYGLVAKWHETVHPGHAFSACPVCDRDLTEPGAIPRDALLDQSVADALEQARKTDAALIKTASEWERDAVRALRGQLPVGLQPFVSDNVPDDLAMVYMTALSKEVFEQPDFVAERDPQPVCLPQDTPRFHAGDALQLLFPVDRTPRLVAMRGDGLPVEFAGERDDLQVRKLVRRRADHAGLPLAHQLQVLFLTSQDGFIPVGGFERELDLRRHSEPAVFGRNASPKPPVSTARILPRLDHAKTQR